jgi:hypothetical protein
MDDRLVCTLHIRHSSVENTKYQVSHKHSNFSRWWTRSRPKHVEKINKRTKKNCSPSWLYFQDNKCKLSGPDGRNYVWGIPGEAPRAKSLRPAVQRGDSVMVWGVGYLHFTGGNMNRHVYVNILRKHLKVSIEKLGFPENFAFDRDDDPKILHIW